MPQCSVCHRDDQPGREVRVYTGRILRLTHPAQGADEQEREGVLETSYGDFAEHRYRVCNRCRSRWDWGIVPTAIGLAIMATMTIASAALRHDADWLFALAIAVLVGGILGARLLSINEQLKRKARRARGQRGSARAFSEQEYQAMLHMG